MKEVDDLKDFLNNAHGEITIRVDGMIPHISGTINDSGMIMGCHVNGKIGDAEYD